MADTTSPAPDIYNRLLQQGTPQEEIDEVYRKLREAGYGEDAARRRLEMYLRRVQEQRQLAERRTGKGDSGRTPRKPASGESESRGKTSHRRMEDWFPEVDPLLRRRINKWARKNNLAITGTRERLMDFVSVFRPRTRDLVNPRLLLMLGRQQHYLTQNPYGYSLNTTLDAMYVISRTLLGHGSKDDEKVIREALSRREPFGLEYLSRFAHFDDTLRQSLGYLKMAHDQHVDVEVSALARVTRETYRLVMTTELISKTKVTQVLDVASGVLVASGIHDGEGLEDAAAIFKIGLENLQRFKAELYPAVLKSIGHFFDPVDTSPDKRRLIAEFLDIRTGDLLTVKGFYEQQGRRKEQMLAQTHLLELEAIEREKESGFTHRFAGVLAILSSLFPDSGIGDMESASFLVPYFDSRVFVSSLGFETDSTQMETLSRYDPVQPILVVHRIIDNLINAIDHLRLEELLSRNDVAGQFAEIKDQWTDIYTAVFSPYLRDLNEFAKGLSDEEHGKAFLKTSVARALEERINQLRNRLIRNYGEHLPRRSPSRELNLWLLVERLALLLSDVGEEIHQDIARRNDPVSRKLYDELGKTPVIDLKLHTSADSPDFKPVVRQVRRYIEAKYHSSLVSIPRVAQLFLLDILRGTVELYRSMTNEDDSFLRAPGRRILVAGQEEHDAWQRERGTRGGDLDDRLRIRLDEQLVSGYTDALTGLKTKNYLLEKLPAVIEKLNRARKPLGVALIDIDHFKWVNDELGHQKGDEVLQDAAMTVLDSIRRGNDTAIRYGGEELMVVIVAPMQTAIGLAERLRHTQSEKVANQDLYVPIASINQQRGEPCGTFSVGVSSLGKTDTLEACINRADKALYESKRQRNTVTVAQVAVDGNVSFETFADYASRTREAGS